MSRRGRSGPTISLFSFQDIITSVTAIVTVVTLLLALDLVQRKQAQSSDSSQSTATDIAARVEELEVEVSKLQLSIRAAEGVAQNVTEKSANELKNEIMAKNAAVTDLEAARSKFQAVVNDWQRREKRELERQFDQQPLRDEQQALSKSMLELEQEIEHVESDDRMIYQMPRGAAKSGWIVEIGTDSVRVAPIGRRQAPILFNKSNSRKSPIDSFQQWIQGDGHDQEYFFILARPGAAAEFHELQGYLRTTRISYGVDLIGLDEQVLDSELGAAQ